MNVSSVTLETRFALPRVRPTSVAITLDHAGYQLRCQGAKIMAIVIIAIALSTHVARRNARARRDSRFTGIPAYFSRSHGGKFCWGDFMALRERWNIAMANATRCAKFAKREAHVRYTLRNQHPPLSRGALRSPIEKFATPRLPTFFHHRCAMEADAR